MGFPWKTCVVASVLAASVTPAAAQQAAPAASSRYLVTVVRLRPDMVTEWQDLQRNEQMPAQKKGGVTSRTTLQTVVGNAFEYAIITPFQTFGGFDGQNPVQKALGSEAAARLAAKIRKCILTQSTYMLTRRDDLSLAPPPGAVAVRTTIRRPAPGKQEEYLNYIKTDLLPAMKKAKDAGKMAGYLVSLRNEGAQAGEVTTSTYYNKFADMDAGNPVVQVLGQTAAAPILAKGTPLATTVQTVIRRRIADLSF